MALLDLEDCDGPRSHRRAAFAEKWLGTVPSPNVVVREGNELIGREREVAEVASLVARHRVVLVYGAAGVGKTTLVTRALADTARAGELPEVVHVSLAGVTDPREAIERTARAIGEPRPAPTPQRVVYALAELLTRAPRTVVWDDLDDRSRPFGAVVAKFAQAAGPARLVLVSRRYFTAKEATFRAPTFAVEPLAREDAVRLVHALEEERGKTLAESLAEATGGNPLLVKLALADDKRMQGDATVAMRRSIEERANGVAGKILAFLVAADAPIDEHELIRSAGKGAREAIADLRRYLLVSRESGRVSVTPPAVPLARQVLGDPDESVWRVLARIGEAELAASAHDDVALVLAARARLETGDAEKALAIVHAHPAARAAAPTAALDRLLRDVAGSVRHGGGRDGGRMLASTSLRILAREQLRVGDYDAARRTLDEIPPAKNREDAERIALLRAEASVRAGEPAAAQRALDSLGDRKNESAGVVLTRAQFAILRGEHAEARATLERVAAKTNDIPQLEARRAVQMAGSHLYEERYDLVHAWIGRARATQIAAGIPVESIVTILDVHALLGLGDVDRAEEVMGREARGKHDMPALEIATLVRRGDLVKALEQGDAALASLDRRTDLLFRSVLARDLARASLGTGQLARAAKMMRLAETGADDSALAALRPICDAELARVAEAEGDIARARRWIERAYNRVPGSPFITIDREAYNGRVPVAPRDAPAVVRAYASLRSAELELMTGALEEAREAAVVAERFYAGARLHRETARARLAHAEALARLGEREAADETLASCEGLAAPHGYVPTLVACALVRAHLAEARGDLPLAARALETAVRTAGDSVDTALERAAIRLDVAVRSPRGDAATRRPYEAHVARLGLGRPAEIVWRVGTRTYLRGAAEETPERVACTVDLLDRKIDAGPGRSLDLPEQRVALLCALAEAGDQGATLEELFARVWRGTFHPLRHRNAVYVALTRLKDSLKPLGREIRIAHDADRYRLAGTLPVAVRRKADRDGLRAALERPTE
jgi:hypothetical protein